MSEMTPREAYEEALNYGWSQKLEDIIVDSDDPRAAFLFASNIPGANIYRLKQSVIDSGNLHYIGKISKLIKTDAATFKELEDIFKYFHLSSQELNMGSEKFTFTPRIPREPMEEEDNFTPRVSLGKTIDECIVALDFNSIGLYVYAVDLKDKSEDDVDLFSTKERFPSCPSGPESNKYGPKFNMYKYIRYKYRKDMEKLGIDADTESSMYSNVGKFVGLEDTKERLFGTGTRIPKEFKGCVPDAEKTDEMWSTKDITMYYIGRIVGDVVALSETGKKIVAEYGKNKNKLRKEIGRQIRTTILEDK